MRLGLLTFLFVLFVCTAAEASVPNMWLDESVLEVIRPKGSKFIVILTDEGLLLTLTKAGVPRADMIWAPDKWHQVVPVELWRRQGVFVQRIEVSRDGAAIVLSEVETELEKRDPKHVLATVIETRSGQTNVIILLEDVVGHVSELKKTPFVPEHFYWGFVHTIDHLKTLRIYTCEGKVIEYSFSGKRLGEKQLPGARWKKTPDVSDFELVCGEAFDRKDR